MTAPGNDEARRVLESCPFVRDLGLRLEALGEGGEVLVSKATVTLAIVPRPGKGGDEDSARP